MGNWKLAEPVMLYAKPSYADAEMRLRLTTMLLLGESATACAEAVERYTQGIVDDLNATSTWSRDDGPRGRAWHAKYRALIELRNWLLQPVCEHAMAHPEPICIARSEWERMRGKER